MEAVVTTGAKGSSSEGPTVCGVCRLVMEHRGPAGREPICNMTRLLGPLFARGPGDSRARFWLCAFLLFQEMDSVPMLRSFGDGDGEGGGVF